MAVRVIGIVTRRHGRAVAARGLDAAALARRAERGDPIGKISDDPALPALIHELATKNPAARQGRLVVVETTTLDTRLVLRGDGAHDARQLEAALSEAASLAAHLVGTGAAVELVGPGLHVQAGRGRAHLRRLLTALALYEPAPGTRPPHVPARPGFGEIEVALG